jgi:hypothetical protein
MPRTAVDFPGIGCRSLVSFLFFVNSYRIMQLKVSPFTDNFSSRNNSATAEFSDDMVFMQSPLSHAQSHGQAPSAAAAVAKPSENQQLRRLSSDRAVAFVQPVRRH